MRTFFALLCCYGAIAAAQEAKPDPADQAATSAAQVQEKPAATNQPDAQSRQSSRQSGSAKQADRLDLDTTVVTGNRELPKVLYIVPWKKAEIGDLPAQPFNTLLDEVLAPVDRDVFKREVKYFHTVTQGDTAAAPKAGEAKESSAPPR